jgi:hypothetical protein
MCTDGHSYQSLAAEYAAAVAQQRAEWSIATDAGVSAVERVKAYARWLAAAERIKALSISVGDDQGKARPADPATGPALRITAAASLPRR